MTQGKRQMLDVDHPIGALLNKLEQVKDSIRADQFKTIKRQFVYLKIRYRSLAKNTEQLHTLEKVCTTYVVDRQM